MKRYPILFAFAALFLVACTPAGREAAAQTRPLVLVFAAGSDSQVVATTETFMREMCGVDTLLFSPDHPTIARAVLERRLKRELVNQVPDPGKAVQIAGAVGAAYALRVKGAVEGLKVSIETELFKVPGGGRWTAGAESWIAEAKGSRAGLNRRNAISTAVSSAVSQIGILAFGNSLSMAPQRAPEVVRIPATAPTDEGSPRDLVAEYSGHIQQADKYAQKGDVPNTIYELRRAINLEPDKAGPRVRLAAAYSSLGMVELAIDECRRALLFNPDDASIHNALVKFYLANGALGEAAAQCREILRLEPGNVEVRLNLGDIYWNQGRIDEAAKSFEGAAQLDPKNPTPRERLHKLYAARKMYPAALEQLLLAKLAVAEDADSALGRYPVFAQVVRDQFADILGKLRAAANEFDRRKISREQYYQECADMSSQAEGLADFVSMQIVPAEFKSAHAHVVLAVSLLAQSYGSLLLYLETEKMQYADQAGLLRSEAEAELDLFGRALGKT